jgi:hypothetical protein
MPISPARSTLRRKRRKRQGRCRRAYLLRGCFKYNHLLCRGMNSRATRTSLAFAAARARQRLIDNPPLPEGSRVLPDSGSPSVGSCCLGPIRGRASVGARMVVLLATGYPFYPARAAGINLNTAVGPLLVPQLLESTSTCSCWGFHQSGALRSSRTNACTAPKWYRMRVLGYIEHSGIRFRLPIHTRMEASNRDLPSSSVRF